MYNFSAITKNLPKNQDFKAKINKIKTHTEEENIEEQYIKGLQDEIKFLEYELKLLKDKEIEQQQSLSQLDQFFNDGVPLNENILAMKNQYNVTKADNEKQIEKMKADENNLAEDIKKNQDHCKQFDEYISLIEKKLFKKRQKLQKIIDGEREQYLIEKGICKKLAKKLDKTNKNLRKYQQEILKTNRVNEREKILGKTDEQKKREIRENNEKQIILIDDKILKQTIDNQQDLNDLIRQKLEKLEEKIVNLRSEETSLSNKRHQAEEKIKSIQQFLEAKKKDRLKIKKEHKKQEKELEKLALLIEKEQKLNEEQIHIIVEQRWQQEILKQHRDQENLQNEINFYSNRLMDIENNTKALIDAKISIEQDKIDENYKMEKTKAEFKDLDNHLREINLALKMFKRKEKDNLQEIEPLDKEVKVLQEQIQILENDNNRKIQQIEFLRKKKDLQQFLKNFNLEELKLVIQSNNQVHETIQNVMRKWDILQRPGQSSPSKTQQQPTTYYSSQVITH